MVDRSVSSFLGLGSEPTLRFCLPLFDRGAMPASWDGSFLYPGNAFADRDVLSAFHVQRLASEAGAEVRFVAPHVLADQLGSSQAEEVTSVIFGSRSNSALKRAMDATALQHLFGFEFGDQWAIRLADGRRYALDDPSKLSRDAYTASVDFGVIAGCSAVGGGRSSLFVVAGLGGRATEGCGLFLQREWRRLADMAGGRAFAAVLRFDPPVDPKSAVLENVVIH